MHKADYPLQADIAGQPAISSIKGFLTAPPAMEHGAETREVKRRRILNLLCRRNVSELDVLAVLGTLEQQGHAVSRREVRECVDDFTDGVLVPLSIPTTSGPHPFVWTIAKFQHLLARCLAKCEGARSEFRDATARTPNSSQRPWRLALYVDGVVPGDVLRLDNKRKATCFYLGILEMRQYLGFEEAWVS